MAVKYLRGPFMVKWLPVKVSDAQTAGTFAARSAAGLITPGTATSTELVGLLMKTITSADADYAESRSVPVMVALGEQTIFQAYGEAHGVTEAMNGEFIDISDKDTLNGGANSLEVIKVEKYISATVCEFSIARKSGVAASTNAD